MIGALDSDNDGYPNAVETAMGKDPFAYCAVMRADVNDDGLVNVLDLTTAASQFLKSTSPGTLRYDQNSDAQVNILDLTAMASVFLRSVTACP